MCFNISLNRQKAYIEKQFRASFASSIEFQPIYHASAFKMPLHPVITDEDTKIIQMVQWGLIPFWVKDDNSAKKIRFQTLNARSETIFDKPSFRLAILERRCLILVDGFYEWRDFNSNKYPYYIKLKNDQPFALAGLWEDWQQDSSKEIIKTFSIITTQANELLAKVHNSKKRMPVIIKKEDEKGWLEKGLEKNEIMSFLNPFESKEMEAYTVSRLISARGAMTNIPEVLEKFEYKELEPI